MYVIKFTQLLTVFNALKSVRLMFEI